MKIGSHKFNLIAYTVLRRVDGTIFTDRPQSRFRNTRNLVLHKYGDDEFCKIRIPRVPNGTGVYVILVDDVPSYVGECIHLEKRYNSGYGQISPRNCFNGGQSTNCRINKLLLSKFLLNSKVELWFLPTPDHKAIEAELLQAHKWPWNQKGIRPSLAASKESLTTH